MMVLRYSRSKKIARVEGKGMEALAIVVNQKNRLLIGSRGKRGSGGMVSF